MIVLKKAGYEDMPQILELKKLILMGKPPENQESVSFFLRNYGWWFRKIEEGGKMVAFLYGRPVEGKKMRAEMYHPDFFPEGDSLAILGLAVHSGSQKEKMGEFLIRDFLYLCGEAGMRRMILACGKEEISYYKQFDFMETGLSELTYGNAPCYDMVRDL